MTWDNSYLTALNNLVNAIKSIFPNGNNTATTATAGSGTLPAAPAKFLVITVSGTTYKVPLYNP